jgi:two-component system sensor kinase FixL
MPASDARLEDDRVIRGLRLRVLWVLGLLGLLAIGSYALFRRQSAALVSSVGVINICGRQRMLSQRAALLIGELEAAVEPLERRQLSGELMEIAATMEGHHRRLVGEGATPSLAPARVRQLIADCPHDLDRSLRRFVAGVRAAARGPTPGAEAAGRQAAAAFDAARSGAILAALEHVVTIMQEHSENSVARLQRAQLVALALFLGALAVLIALVFQPMLRDLRRHLAELRESREALREGREQLQLNFENAPLGIARCSMEGSLLSVNPAFCRVLGSRAEELVGRQVEELLHGDDFARLAKILSTPRGAREPQAKTVRLRHRDGSWVTGVVHWSFVSDESGTPLGLIAHFEDRTRQLEVEEQARQDRERLAQMARLHTLGEMAASIAHEVNQPLTAISNYAQAGRRLLESGLVDSGELESTLDKVSAQAWRAGEVIRGLRSFVRRRRSRSERVDLNVLVRDAVSLALADAHFLSVGVETELAPDLPEVAVDPVQIQQVVLNLIRNAIEALDPDAAGEPVEVRTGSDGDGFVEVAVEDHGTGIPEEIRPRLFDTFVTSKESGLGMGLVISRSIVTSHGGRLWWTPGRRGGTIFHFSLPAVGVPVA